jgi:hypothetical protein
MAQFHWREKVGFALLVLAAAVANKACAQNIVLDSSVSVALEPLAEDSIEHVACLYGVAAPGQIELVVASLPKQAPTGTHNVSADSGSCMSALVIWHNHAVPKDSVAESYLYFSLQDEHTFVYSTDAPLAAVGVPHKTCFWDRQQVQAGWAENRTPLRPVAGQCVAY